MPLFRLVRRGELSVLGVCSALAFSLIFALSPYSAAAQTPQRLTIGGAQSLAPLAERFSAAYKQTHPGTTIEVKRGNSNHAIAAAERGEIQIGLITRNLTAAESAGLRVQALRRDAIILLSYSWNKVANLTLEQLRGIYTGKITNWREVGGEDKGVVPLTREADSGIHAMFVETLFGKSGGGQEKAFVLRASKDKILRTIKRVRGSIGYGIVAVEEATAEGIKVLDVDGKGPTEANIQQGIYPFTRPRLLISKSPDAAAEEWMRGFADYLARGEGAR
jgi:phosphate transport system substrate-binding protein